MTHSDAVQNAYRWALDTWGNKKSGIMQLQCARQVQTAVESSEQYDIAYGMIAGLVAQWRMRIARKQSQSEGLQKSIDVLTMLLGLEAERSEAVYTPSHEDGH